MPEQVTINIGEGAKVPPPPLGHKYVDSRAPTVDDGVCACAHRNGRSVPLLSHIQVGRRGP